MSGSSVSEFRGYVCVVQDETKYYLKYQIAGLLFVISYLFVAIRY